MLLLPTFHNTFECFKVDEHGWTAEFRIPYTQLRFPHTKEMIWGIQFTRDIARKKELVYWAPLSSQESGTVSKYGTLRGLNGIQSQWRLEVAPYSLGRLQRAVGDSDDPFFKENDPFATLGMDLKYGLMGNFTLDVTVNPDFGQVLAESTRSATKVTSKPFVERRWLWQLMRPLKKKLMNCLQNGTNQILPVPL